ncbi:putative cytochrome P450 [Mycobacterium xenopi 4042]|uniref:Putative cytochrome P450 n=1 Tax=Mycobacterium xenopi 4042 TaxID=1299334 RepID=X8DE41_MYCXE|nr:putative cytochrome P450 [Mycobacterium xenopi 4042]
MGIATRVNGTAPPRCRWPTSTWVRGISGPAMTISAMGHLRRCGARRRSRFGRICAAGFPVGAGHWALTKYDDVFYASRHPEIFSSHPNITIADQPVEVAEYFGSMIALDDPRHQRLRSIVSRAFTPKVVARTEASVRDRAQRLVAEMIARHPDGKGELVTELSGPLPLQVICDMMGIPEDDHERVFHWTNVILGFGDPDLGTDFEKFTKVSLEIGAMPPRWPKTGGSTPATT